MAVLKMYCQFAAVSFCKPTLTLCELVTALTKQMYNNMYCTVLCMQLVMCGGRDRLGKCY
jgi:hypothetical protein